jgi:hypothetical protein
MSGGLKLVAFSVVMSQVFSYCATKRRLSDEDHFDSGIRRDCEVAQVTDFQDTWQLFGQRFVAEKSDSTRCSRPGILGVGGAIFPDTSME